MSNYTQRGDRRNDSRNSDYRDSNSRNYNNSSRSYSDSRSNGGRSRSGSNYFNNRRKGNKPAKNQIDIDLYTHKVDHSSLQAKAEKTKTGLKFSDLGLNSRLLGVINKRGFEHPTEIQSKIIPQLLKGDDVVAVSQTGSGKTGAYLIPLINHYLDNPSGKDIGQTLIIVPTRELAYQVEKEIFLSGSKLFGLFSLICIGGTDLGRQIRMAKKTNHFIIGTPGRLIDLIEKGALDLKQVSTVIVDEMDKMLDMGFIDDIEWLVSHLPEKRQAGFFSATTSKKVLPILQKLAPGVKITTVNHPKPSEFVEQQMLFLQRHENKLDALLEILEPEKKKKSIIFVNTKSETERVAEKLMQNNYDVDFLHGDRPQNARTRIINFFKRNEGGVLVATDVAARGLDIDDVAFVINYDEPNTVDDYIHRVGRTGRAGRTGKAVTFVQR